MANVLTGHRAVAARQIRVGTAATFAVKSGQLVKIIDLQGKQVASVMAFAGDGYREVLSPSVTLTANASLILQTGNTLYSDAHTPMFELVDDTVQRHDLLTSALTTDKDGAALKQSTREAFGEALAESEWDLTPRGGALNFFKHVVIKQRGDIEVKEPFSERNDSVTLRALTDGIVLVANAYPEKKPGIAAARSSSTATGALLVRVYD